MTILIQLLLLTNLHLKLLSTQGTGADKLLSTQRVKYIEGLELKRTISTFLKKWAKCTFRVLSNHTLHVRGHCILYLVKDA